MHSVAKLSFVWDLADLFMAMMAMLNLVAIALLGKRAYIALDDYVRQKKAGVRNPEFDPAVMPDRTGIMCWPRHKEEELDQDREFLTRGDVFTDDFIDAYIALKMEEVTRARMAVTALDFDLYYSL